MEVVLPIAMEHREQCWHTHMGSSTDRGFSAGKIHVVIAGFFFGFLVKLWSFHQSLGKALPLLLENTHFSLPALLTEYNKCLHPQNAHLQTLQG